MLLLVTAAQIEADALVAGLDAGPGLAPGRLGPYPAHLGAGVAIVAGGLGPAAAAAATATALTLGGIDAVLSVGIAGGFGLPLGSLVVADQIVPADLGAHSPDGWLGAEELGWPEQLPLAVPGAAALSSLLAARLEAVTVRCGPVLTLSAMTGTAARAQELAARFGAAAEAMEGYGAALAARRHEVRVGEIRTVSNEVGPRDRASWDVPAALDTLRRAAPILREAWG